MTARITKIALLPGDGIGAEILDGPVAYLRRLQGDGLPVVVTGPWPYGTSGWVETGSTLPDKTLQACREADVVLSGAVGTHPGVTAQECPNPEAALIALRHEFDLRISVRTVRVPGGDDVVIVRNITGGAYARPDQRVESDGVRPAEDHLALDPVRVREVFDIAAGYARAAPGGGRSASTRPASSRRPGCGGGSRGRSGRSTTSTSTGRRTSWCGTPSCRRSPSPRACSATSSPTSCAPAPGRRPCAGPRRSTPTAGSGTA